MTRYAVMVNDELFPRSVCTTREFAETYLDDARHAAAPKSHVRVVKLTITELAAGKKKKSITRRT